MMSNLALLQKIDALERRLRDLERMEAGTSSAYTPVYQGLTTGGVTTYSVQVGAYTRVGDVVSYWAYVAWTAATGTGIAAVSLPFTARNTTNLRGAAAVYTTSVTFTGSGVQGLIIPNTAYVQFYSPISNATRADVTIEAAGEIVISGVFFV